MRTHAALRELDRRREVIRQRGQAMPLRFLPRRRSLVPADFRDDVFPRVLAVLVAAAILGLGGKLLATFPGAYAPQEATARMRLSFIAREEAAVESPRTPPAPSTREPAPPGARTPGDARAPIHPVQSAVPALPAPRTEAVIYTREGGIRLPADLLARAGEAGGKAAPPPGAPDASRDDAQARRLLERRNPVDYRPTRFARDWISDGDAADVAEQEIARVYSKIAELLFGRDVQPAQARPPPEVRFNPGRHAQAADLGREQTGDAYKAAPLNFEKAPGLEGEASRRIRAGVAELERRHAGCSRAQRSALMAPLLPHLQELQRVEYAHAHGADPVRAEHLLPRAADSAYDLSRRALWHADRQLARCSRQ